MATVTSVTKYFPVAKEGFVTTLASSISSGASTVPLNSVTGYSSGDIAVLTIDPGDINKKQVFTGVVDTSGVQLTNVVWTEGTNQSHTTGATVVDYVAATHMSMVTAGIKKEHNDDGTHAAITPTSVTTSSITNTGPLTSTGTTQLNGVFSGWTGANETWSYSSYDSTNKTGVITVPSDGTTKYSAGMRVMFTNNSATQYGIITKVSSTSITVYFGTDYSLTNSAITSPFYSVQKAPFGFPLDRTKWTVTVTNTASTVADPGGLNTWINDKSISISVPIGTWELSLQGLLRIGVTSSSKPAAAGGLSTGATSAPSGSLAFEMLVDASAASIFYRAGKVSDNIAVTSATTYYLVVEAVSGSGTVTIGFDGSGPGVTTIKAVCNYL